MTRTHSVRLGTPPDPTVIRHGEQLTLNNVGVQGAGNPTLTDSPYNNMGGVSLDPTFVSDHETAPGSKLIYRKRFLNVGFNVLSNTPTDVEFRECLFEGTGGGNSNVQFSNVFGSDPPPTLNLKVRWCTFDGSAIPDDNGARDVACFGLFGYYTMERCLIQGYGNGIRGNGGLNVTIRECYIRNMHPNTTNPDPHCSGIGANSSEGPTLIERCKVFPGEGPHPQAGIGLSGACVFYDQPSQTNVTFRDNALQDSGSYALYVLMAGVGSTNNVFTGNIFYRDRRRLSGPFGPVTASGTVGVEYTWANNRWGPRGPLWQSGDPEEGALINIG